MQCYSPNIQVICMICTWHATKPCESRWFSWYAWYAPLQPSHHAASLVPVFSSVALTMHQHKPGNSATCNAACRTSQCIPRISLWYATLICYQNLAMAMICMTYTICMMYTACLIRSFSAIPSLCMSLVVFLSYVVHGWFNSTCTQPRLICNKPTPTGAYHAYRAYPKHCCDM